MPWKTGRRVTAIELLALVNEQSQKTLGVGHKRSDDCKEKKYPVTRNGRDVPTCETPVRIVTRGHGRVDAVCKRCIGCMNRNASIETNQNGSGSL